MVPVEQTDDYQRPFEVRRLHLPRPGHARSRSGRVAPVASQSASEMLIAPTRPPGARDRRRHRVLLHERRSAVDSENVVRRPCRSRSSSSSSGRPRGGVGEERVAVGALVGHVLGDLERRPRVDGAGDGRSVDDELHVAVSPASSWPRSHSAPVRSRQCACTVVPVESRRHDGARQRAGSGRSPPGNGQTAVADLRSASGAGCLRSRRTCRSRTCCPR